MAKRRINGERMMGWFFGITTALLVTGFLIALGQQLVWQLRRADCGSYTVAQKEAGEIPLQCNVTVEE